MKCNSNYERVRKKVEEAQKNHLNLYAVLELQDQLGLLVQQVPKE